MVHVRGWLGLGVLSLGGACNAFLGTEEALPEGGALGAAGSGISGQFAGARQGESRGLCVPVVDNCVGQAEGAQVCKHGSVVLCGLDEASTTLVKECSFCEAGRCYCPADTYGVNGSLDVCVGKTTCRPGEFISSEGDEMTDRSCAACGPGMFSARKNAQACRNWSCSDSWEVQQPGTPTSDAVCSPLRIRQFGAPLSTTVATAVAVDSRGNVYVAGTTIGALEGKNAGGLDAHVRKYDGKGNHEWTAQFGSAGKDYATAVAVDDNGNVFVVGFTTGSLVGDSSGKADAYVRKYSSIGTHLWTERFGTEVDDQAHAVAVDGGGNVYILGETQGYQAGVQSDQQVHLRKFDGSGSALWTQQVRTGGSSVVGAVAVDGSGNIYVATLGASFVRGEVRKYDTAGTQLVTTEVHALDVERLDALAVALDGSVYLAGITAGTVPGEPGGYLRKYDNTGAYQWGQVLEGAPATEVALDESGNVYVGGLHLPTGDYLNERSAHVWKYNGSGIQQWAQGFSAWDLAGIAADASGNVYAAGSAYEVNSGFSEAYVVQLQQP
jgi:hypothetical protein